MNILLSQSNEHLPISGLNFQFLLERGIFYYSYFSNKETKLKPNFISWEETPKKPVPIASKALFVLAKKNNSNCQLGKCASTSRFVFQEFLGVSKVKKNVNNI